jgi:hypothetical protein
LVYQGRDTYSFWAPLDEEFLLCMVKVGYWKQFELIDPFWTSCYFAHLDYTNEQSSISNLSANAAATVLNADENAAVYAALSAGAVTNTGLAYQEYSQPGPPVLKLTGSGGQALLDWTPVALKFLLEQNTNLSAAAWSPLTVPLRAVGSDFMDPIATTNPAGFYRLHQP